MIEAVIFDYGGVYGNDTDRKAIEEFAKLVGISQNVITQAVNRLLPIYQNGIITDGEFFIALSSRLQKKIPAECAEIFTDTYRKNASINEEVREIALELRRQGYKLGLLSNTIHSHAFINRQKGNFDDFEAVVLSCEEGCRKPQKKAYRLIAQRLGTAVEACLFIDDKPEFVTAAKEAGLKAVLYESPPKLKSDMERLCSSGSKRNSLAF